MSISPRRVAIVGGGAGGIGAAWGLAEAGHHVTLIEAASALGGHARAVDVTGDDGRRWRIDAGVSDFNRATFTNLVALLDRLGLRARPIGQDASFMRRSGELVWASRAGHATFADATLDEARLRAELARFARESVEALAPGFERWTLGAYLDARGYSPAFRAACLYPRARGAFPMPGGPAAAYDLRSLIRFWRIHGVVGGGPAPRMVLEDGMHAYGPVFARWLERRGGRVLLGAKVGAIARTPHGVRLALTDAGGAAATLGFDDVVLAVNAHQVLPLLADAGADERAALSGIAWQAARVVVHRDRRLMPARRDAWGAFNYLVTDEQPGERDERPDELDGAPGPTITFHPNRLAGLPAACPDVFVTLNPFREPAPESVLTDGALVHPVAGPDVDRAAARVAALQGRRRTWYCGSYLRSPWVHEEALTSGLEVAAAIVRRASAAASAGDAPAPAPAPIAIGTAA